MNQKSILNRLLIALFVLVLTTGCASTKSTKSLGRISLDTTKEDVMREMGEPTAVRGCIKNQYGQVIEVWEYKLDKGKTGKQLEGEWLLTIFTLGLMSPALFSEGETEYYWLYFYNNNLVQWGQAGDWEKAADRIYEINFDKEPKVTR